MRSATRLSVSWDRSHSHRHLVLVVGAPRAADSGARRHGDDVRAPAPSSRRRPRARSRGRRPRAASRRAWPRPRRCVLSTPTAVPYMAAVIDLCTRMAPVLAFPGRTAADLPIAALGPSRGRGYVALGAISRSDCGSQHASKAMADRAHDVRLPAGETGPRHDDAVAEPFLGTSENETCHPRSFATRKEARLASAGYVEGYHDRRRPHSTIDYHIPERRWTHSSSARARWSRERRRCHWRHDYGPLAVRGVETVQPSPTGAKARGGRRRGRARPHGEAHPGPTPQGKEQSTAPTSRRARLSVTSPPGRRGARPPRQTAGHYEKWPNWANALGQPPARLRGSCAGPRRPRPGAWPRGKAQSEQGASLMACPASGRRRPRRRRRGAWAGPGAGPASPIRHPPPGPRGRPPHQASRPRARGPRRPGRGRRGRW